MYNRLFGFVKKFNILATEQHGFLENKSTITASHSFIGKIQQALDNKLHAIGIFLDLTKAFDVINHNILLSKLQSYGIRGTLNSWFRSYLSGRSQYVSLTQTNNFRNNIMGNFSSPLQINPRGVPQGSILGPLLFLIYINDLPRQFQGMDFVLYADDTSILLVDKDEAKIQHKLTLLMTQLESWLNINDLVVNTDKTCAISFHTYQKPTPIKPLILFKDKTIDYKSEMKFLGLKITDTLAWHTHIYSLSSSLSKSYFMIKSLKPAIGEKSIWNIYFAYFESKLRYGIMFWGGDSKSIILFRLQKKVVRLITGVPKYTSCRPIFKRLKILTITSLYIYETLCFLKKHNQNLKFRSEIHEYNTRSRNDLYQQYCNTCNYQKSVLNIGTKLFNKLPLQIKQLDDSNKFKKELKNFLLVNSFYTIAEFFSF